MTALALTLSTALCALLGPDNLPSEQGWTFLSPEQQIRERWAGTGDEDQMVSIAWRESRFECDANNPSSSAAGLFQTLRLHEPRAEALGLTWEQVSSECWASIELAYDLWSDAGTTPWRLTR